MSHTGVRESSSRVDRVDRGAQKDSTNDQVKRFAFDTRFIARCFAIVIPTIVVCGAIANYAIYNLAPHPDHPIADVLKRFDLGHEPSIPAFYSASVMLVSAMFLTFLGRFDHSGGTSRQRYWYALGLLFLLLAIDEAVIIHEMGTAAMDGLNLSGPFYFSWVIPGLIFTALVGVFFLRFLLTLNARTRNLLILSGVVFVSGAVGMELIAGLIFGAAENETAAISSVSHVIVQAIEEGLEMTGVAIFLCALVDYANIKGLGLEVFQRDEAQQQGASS